MTHWMTKLLVARKQPLRCVYCGVEAFRWPRTFDDAWLEEHRCPSERGHFFTNDPIVADLVRAS